MPRKIVVAETSTKVIIVGTSVRAAAWSALRAGFEPYCVDLFADRDLSRVATVRAIAADDYPEGLEQVLADVPAAAWFFTGALENYPKLVERLNRRLPLWGNGPTVLRRVRSPFLTTQALQQAKLPCPEVRRMPPGMRVAGRWLLKPRGGAGGRGIAFWDEVASARPPRACYFQEWIDGESFAAVYLAPGDGTAQLLGVTRQWIGQSWLNAGPFQYCGSLGPWPVPSSLRARYQFLGNRLARDFDLRGLFGIDCVVRDDVPWPVEINPRYTASMEIIEWAHRQALLVPHAAAFGFEHAAQASDSQKNSKEGMFAKAVFYAGRPMVFPEDGPWCDTLAQPWKPWIMPDFADIPAAGRRFLPGEPVLTMLARGDSMGECTAILNRRALEIGPLAV